MEPSVVPDVPPQPAGAVAAAGRTERARHWLATHRAVVAIVVVAFVLRLAWVLWWHPSEPTVWQESGDQFSYYHYGREIAAGNGYVHYVRGVPTAYYPIGYPAILAALFFVVGHTPIPDDYMMALNIQNVVVGTASVVLAYVIGRALFGERGGLAGAAILAVFPNLVFQVATVQLETMYIFWCLAALAIVVTHDWSRGLPSTRRLVAFGAVLGVSVLIRPFSIWFIAALFAGALVARVGFWRSVKVAAVPLAVVLLMMVPWTIRNAVRLDAFVPTSTNTGDTLCLDRFEGANGGFRWADHEGCADPGLPEVERNNANTRMAINWVLDNPAREALQITRRGRADLRQRQRRRARGQPARRRSAHVGLDPGPVERHRRRRLGRRVRPGDGRGGPAARHPPPPPPGDRHLPRQHGVADRGAPTAVGQPALPPAVRAALRHPRRRRRQRGDRGARSTP